MYLFTFMDITTCTGNEFHNLMLNEQRSLGFCLSCIYCPPPSKKSSSFIGEGEKTPSIDFLYSMHNFINLYHASPGWFLALFCKSSGKSKQALYQETQVVGLLDEVFRLFLQSDFIFAWFLECCLFGLSDQLHLLYLHFLRSAQLEWYTTCPSNCLESWTCNNWLSFLVIHYLKTIGSALGILLWTGSAPWTWIWILSTYLCQ